MGRYVNPSNDGFACIVDDNYVDKTGLVSLFDSTLNTTRGLVMVSRPRRFGKSFAAQSISAFYSCGADSRALFEGLEVSRRADPPGCRHLRRQDQGAHLPHTGGVSGKRDEAPFATPMMLIYGTPALAKGKTVFL